MLTRRALPVTDAHRARIADCDEVATLEAWLDNAIDAPSVDDVLR